MTKRKNLTDYFDDKWGVPTKYGIYGTGTSSPFDYDKWSDKKPSTFGKSYVRCYETHPPLVIPGTDLVIHGGSCSSPVVSDADIYIGFDHSMKPGKLHPWKGQHNVFFPITDMSVPNSAEAFRDLVHWTAGELKAGKKVHCGCIGGHGRTGMFLAALVKEMSGEEDAISYVRKNYCPKAVETGAQVEWLNKHFGIKRISATKGHHDPLGPPVTVVSGKAKLKGKSKAKPVPEKFPPMKGRGSIWGD